MKEFAQRSVISLLCASTASNSRQGGEVSLAEFLDRKSIAGSRKSMPECQERKKAETFREVASSSCAERVLDSLTSHRLSKKRKRTFSNRRAVAVERGGSGGRRHLLVVGDEPVARPKLYKPQLGDNHNYNHYADGSGWWDEDMVGLEEGATCEWEGVGCVSLGESISPTL